MGAFGSSAKLIASTAEREKLLASAQDQGTPTLTCAGLADISDTVDSASCVVEFGTGTGTGGNGGVDGTAYVSMKGKAGTSYSNFWVCDATKSSASVGEGACASGTSATVASFGA